MLPLGPTGYGDSPYSSFSAFAGNPLLVSLERLAEQGLLDAGELRHGPAFPKHAVDFERVKRAPPAAAREGVRGVRAEGRRREPRGPSTRSCARHAAWLADFALFMALKRANGGAAWNAWERRARRARAGRARAGSPRARARACARWSSSSSLFFEQWAAVRQAARERGIRIMGDVPIFVAHDSADVWAHPDIFQLGRDGRAAFQAGVPPDYFSATGQLWGNPLYRWDALARTGYAWWVDRMRASFELVDLVRLDHFRGFEAYWEVPGDAPTADDGRWVKGPGAALFEAVRAALGELPIVAEDLGVITPEVEALRDGFGLPGMAILQFAFGSDAAGNELPAAQLPEAQGRLHRHPRQRHGRGLVERGSRGLRRARRRRWIASESARSPTWAETAREIHWDFVRTLLVSVADTAIVPLQDVLGLGSEARMNLPGRAQGNWGWRYAADELTPALRQRLRAITEGSGRTPEKAT